MSQAYPFEGTFKKSIFRAFWSTQDRTTRKVGITLASLLIQQLPVTRRCTCTQTSGRSITFSATGVISSMIIRSFYPRSIFLVDLSDRSTSVDSTVQKDHGRLPSCIPGDEVLHVHRLKWAFPFLMQPECFPND